jgi:hypothetical protein
MTQTGSFVTGCAAVSHARLASLGLRCSCLAAEGGPALVAALVAANWEARHSCSSEIVYIAVAVAVAVAAADAAGVEAVASIGLSVVAACDCSARMASAVLAAERVALEMDPAKLLGLVYHAQIACTLQAEEERAGVLVARAHCTAAAVALIGQEALLRRRRGAQRASRTE